MTQTQATPVANADLINTLSAVKDNLSGNLSKVRGHREALQVEIGQLGENETQLVAMIKTIDLLLNDEKSVQTLADALAAEAVANAPLTGAGSTGETTPDSAGDASVPSPANSGYGVEGCDANGSPVAVDSAPAA